MEKIAIRSCYKQCYELCDKDFIDFCREMKIERMDPHFAISLILLYLEKKEKND